MWLEEKINEYLKSNLKNSRYEHSLGVKDIAIKLAIKYGEDQSKSKIAGLVHDCAKNMNNAELINTVQSNGYKIDDICKSNPQLLHGLAGAIISKNIMGIEDDDIFNSITYHTTGRQNMSLLEKIIYIADYIEPSRVFPGIAELRSIAFENLDEALMLSLSNTIRFTINKGELLHSNTVEARNFLLIKNKL